MICEGCVTYVLNILGIPRLGCVRDGEVLGVHGGRSGRNPEWVVGGAVADHPQFGGRRGGAPYLVGAGGGCRPAGSGDEARPVRPSPDSDQGRPASPTPPAATAGNQVRSLPTQSGQRGTPPQVTAGKPENRAAPSDRRPLPLPSPPPHPPPCTPAEPASYHALLVLRPVHVILQLY